MDVCEPFRNKKITLLGLGLLGRGVGDAEFFAECGAELIVTDRKTEAELSESVERLKKYPNITFHLGEQSEEDFKGRDLIIKAAGVPNDSQYIAAATAAGVPVAMSTALFAKYAIEAGATLIGVTGTRGKSTVAHMIHYALSQKDPARVHLGGNIRGVSTLAMLPVIQAGDIVVLELDSWQLQGFGDLKISPQVAIFTNLMPDHMNYYGGDMDAYFADKANIFRYQKEGDKLVVGESVDGRIRTAQPPVTPVVPEKLPEDWQLQIPGEHNRENAALVKAVVESFLNVDQVRAGITTFTSVEGRLQFVRTVNGVLIYNDNNATTPEATIAALRALGGTKNVILITGGADKSLGLEELISEMRSTCKKIVLLDGSGTRRLQASDLAAEGPFPNIKDALDAALKDAAAGDVVLFSPAFASFGMFKNEYERNDEFLALVRAL